MGNRLKPSLMSRQVLAVDAKGNVYVADSGNNAIRKVDMNGNVSTLQEMAFLETRMVKVRRPAFNHPSDVAVAADGTVYVADSLNHAIRKIAVDGNVSTLTAAVSRVIQIRPGEASFAGDYHDGSLSTATFNEPSGLALDSKGNLYVSDTGNQRIRYIDLASRDCDDDCWIDTSISTSTIYEKNELYAGGDFADGDALESEV